MEQEKSHLQLFVVPDQIFRFDTVWCRENLAPIAKRESYVKLINYRIQIKRLCDLFCCSIARCAWLDMRSQYVRLIPDIHLPVCSYSLMGVFRIS